MPYGEMAKLKSSAKNAEAYLAARRELEAKGLFNPMFAKYDAPDMSTYSTLNDGIWDKMSPTRMTDVATFGNPYFEGMKPNIHKESKNGVSYSVESITEKDLKNIADAHFNELVSTPQGQLMFKYYRDLAGGDSNPRANEEAREMFNNAVSDAQRRRIYTKDDYDDQWDKKQQIDQAWARIAQGDRELQLKREQFEWEKDYYANQGNPGSSSSSSSSGGGSGSDTNNLMAAGAASMTSIDQDKQYGEVKEDFENQRRQDESAAYSKLKSEKIWADRYKSATKTLNDKNASEQDKKQAKHTIKFLEESDKTSDDFKSWMKSYKYLNDDKAWSRYSSSIGQNTPWGQTQSESVLAEKAHEAFYRQNVLNSPLDIGARADMNHSLGLVEGTDDDGKDVEIGTVTQGTEFAPVTEAKFTGNRSYRYNSKVSKLNRAIKGKPYNVTPENKTGREYGSG